MSAHEYNLIFVVSFAIIFLVNILVNLKSIVLYEEKEVGPFRADILCQDEATENLVLIENQLEKTDHKHLGQLLTYATGLNAASVVWIASDFNEEHRATLDWLNKITDEKYNFLKSSRIFESFLK